MKTDTRIAIAPDSPPEVAVDVVRAWVDEHVPRAWIEAGRLGGAAAIRSVRTRADNRAPAGEPAS